MGSRQAIDRVQLAALCLHLFALALALGMLGCGCISKSVVRMGGVAPVAFATAISGIRIFVKKNRGFATLRVQFLSALGILPSIGTLT